MLFSLKLLEQCFLGFVVQALMEIDTTVSLSSKELDDLERSTKIIKDQAHVPLASVLTTEAIDMEGINVPSYRKKLVCNSSTNISLNFSPVMSSCHLMAEELG